MAGGDLSEATLVSERYLLDLEREACLYVLKEKTLKESNMLTKGKPLRN
jgi:3-hydroxyacyl-CoA dehydrogenase